VEKTTKDGTFLVCPNGKATSPAKGKGKKKAAPIELAKPCDYSRRVALPAEKASA
jgi:hypothetical protein